jgi:hypothetical protein
MGFASVSPLCKFWPPLDGQDLSILLHWLTEAHLYFHSMAYWIVQFLSFFYIGSSILLRPTTFGNGVGRSRWRWCLWTLHVLGRYHLVYLSLMPTMISPSSSKSTRCLLSCSQLHVLRRHHPVYLSSLQWYQVIFVGYLFDFFPIEYA